MCCRTGRGTTCGSTLISAHLDAPQKVFGDETTWSGCESLHPGTLVDAAPRNLDLNKMEGHPYYGWVQGVLELWLNRFGLAGRCTETMDPGVWTHRVLLSTSWGWISGMSRKTSRNGATSRAAAGSLQQKIGPFHGSLGQNPRILIHGERTTHMIEPPDCSLDINTPAFYQVCYLL